MPMTFANAKRAALLIEAWEGISDVRKGLQNKNLEQDMWLKIAAFDGDESGGSFYGDALIPSDLGPEILDRVLDLLGDELSALDVEVPLLDGVVEEA